MVRHLLKLSTMISEAFEEIGNFMTHPYVFEIFGYEIECIPLELILGSGLTIYLVALIIDFFWVAD